MVKLSLHQSALFLLNLLIPIAGFSNPITPGTPEMIPPGASPVVSATAVAGSSDGFIAVWRDSMNNILWNSSTDGITWNAADIIEMPMGGGTPGENPSVCKGSLGYVAAWYVQKALNNAVHVSLFNGSSWSTPQTLDFSGPVLIGNTVSVAANAQGFMVVSSWHAGLSEHVYSNFSSDGTTWGTKVNISTMPGGYAPSVAGYGNTFIATWEESNNPQASISTDMGTTWNSYSIASDGSAYSQVTVSATSLGYLAAWVDMSGVAHSSFSSDGMVWSAPVQIASGVDTADAVGIGLSGTSHGFIAAWEDSSNNANASFSADGASWSSPVQIGTGLDAITGSLVGVSFFGARSLFTWTGSSDPYSNLSQVQISLFSPHSYQRPSNRR